MNVHITPLELWTYTRSPARRWGLALGADLALVNGSSLRCLHTGYSRTVQRESLAHWWRVHSTDDLRFQLNWLFTGGHDEAFDQIVASASRGAALSHTFDPATQARIEFVRHHSELFRRFGHIRAFDLGRVASLSRFGYSAGYIGAAEAWEWIARAAAKTQPIFQSWADYAANYELGLRFWEATEPDRFNYFKHRRFLLNSRRSPWVWLPWDTPLSSP